MICVPIVSVGFRLVIGSWKTIAIWRPRTSSSSRRLSRVSSRPSKRTEPPTTRPFFGSSPMIESAVTDLPQPDSPTIASDAPSSTAKLTPSTAWTRPCRAENCVLRSSTSSSATARA
jgi:hypothetical protein